MNLNFNYTTFHILMILHKLCGSLKFSQTEGVINDTDTENH